MTTFETTTYGKWILAGEHSVLRGAPALVFPIRSCAMKTTYTPGDDPIRVSFSGEQEAELRLLYWGVLENALEKTGRKRSDLKGSIELHSDLPIGAGLGASAALSVSVGRLWHHLGWVEEENIYEFSRGLEDLFHGESSGVDIAAAMSDQGIRFMRGGERSAMDVNWTPNWYLSYSGKKGVTSECVKKVKHLFETSQEFAEKIDRQMAGAVVQAEKALGMGESEGLAELAGAIDQARDCFHQWGLDEGELDQHMKSLLAKGALAVKPTGSGGGGYVLSLWKEEPPQELLKSELMPL